MTPEQNQESSSICRKDALQALTSNLAFLAQNSKVNATFAEFDALQKNFQLVSQALSQLPE